MNISLAAVINTVGEKYGKVTEPQEIKQQGSKSNAEHFYLVSLKYIITRYIVYYKK